jgi:hypothetical protein
VAIIFAFYTWKGNGLRENVLENSKGETITTSIISGTPRLSKEYIYAGDRMIAIEEDDSMSGSPPTGLVAKALGNPGASSSSVKVEWTSPAGIVDRYEVQRSQNIAGPFTLLSANSASPSFTDSNVTPNTTYLYRVRAVYAGGEVSPYSNIDIATTFAFADDPLNANGVRTTIRAAHFTQLREAVNSVRIAAGLLAFNWATQQPQVGGVIYASHLNDLRANLAEALNRLGLPPPKFSAITKGSPVTSDPVQQLRDLIK